MKVGFIAATKRHLNYKNEVAVRDYYSVSPLFRYSLAYAEKEYDQTLILSFGSPILLTPEDGVNDIDETIEKLAKSDKKKWTRNISQQINDFYPDKADLYFHTPKSYGVLTSWITSFYGSLFKTHYPMRGMSIGKQLGFYKSQVGQLPSIKSRRSK